MRRSSVASVARVAWVCSSLAVVLAWGGCGGGNGFSVVPPSANQQQNVMVIDQGIDLSVAELRGKVSAVYTETCANPPHSDAGPAGDGGAVDAGPAFDALKAQFIAELMAPDDSCHLTPGIAGKADPLASVGRYRSRWNAMVLANQTVEEAFTPAELAQLMDPINHELMTFDYHGTATASLVAHENPDVRLVLVERPLGSEASLETNFPCIVQADVDQLVDLLGDPQVFDAFVNQKASIDDDFAMAMSAHDVGIVNESFGATARQTLEMLQADPKNHCPAPITLSAYFAIMNRAGLAHMATVVGPAVLTVQAAGNDGVEIDSGADSLSCDLGDPLSLLVGSTDSITGDRNTFSNFGACVDVFAPGQSIVVSYAGDWLLWADGTSFAAPLTARTVSMAISASPFAPAQAQAAVLAQRDPTTHFLPVALFPSDVVYLPYALTTDAVIAGVTRRAPGRPPTQVDLHRLFGPLARLQALRHR